MSIFGEYISNQKGIFHTHINKIINKSKHQYAYKKDGYILDWEIFFKDDSVLEAWEVLKITNNKIERKRYGYEYKRPSGFFFFYELSEEQNDLIEKLWKPKYHLHVGVQKENKLFVRKFPELLDHDGPHYKVSPITLKEIIGTIIVNFFPDDKNLLNFIFESSQKTWNILEITMVWLNSCNRRCLGQSVSGVRGQ